MFRGDHRKDFDAVLRAELPFALVRFGDGEAALIEGRPHAAAAGEWSSGKDHWLAGPLASCLAADTDGFCIGLPPRCCLPTVFDLQLRCKAAYPRRTLATLFLHGNLGRMGELIERYRPVLAGPGLDVEIPKHGVMAPFDFDPIVDQIRAIDRPIFISAGPLANVLIDRYWHRQPTGKRQVILDVGSALDYYRTAHATRYYHEGSPRGHHCTFDAAPTTPTSKVKPMVTSNSDTRMIVGRRGQPNTTVSRRGSLGGGGSVRTGERSTIQTSLPNDTTGGIRNRCSRCVKVVRDRR